MAKTGIDPQHLADCSGDAALIESDFLRSSTRVPGVRDFWILIAAECTLFSLFFVSYMVGRSSDIDLYRLSQQALDRNLGAFNTIVLIVGSWSVMQALDRVRRDRARGAARYLSFAIGCGATFFGVKAFEYSDKFSHGILPVTNDFFTFYFVLTMVHLMHLIVGTVVLIVMRRGIIEGRYHRENMGFIESAAIYWHLVDLLWIFLFAILYLLR